MLVQVRRHTPSLVSTRGLSSSGVKGLLSVPIVGRPNVGKSTLFNRFARAAVGRRGGGSGGSVGFGGRRPASKAIVSPVAGTTRDRREGPAAIAGAHFIAVDTGGLESLDGGGSGSAYGDLRSEIAKQVRGVLWIY
jgi:GTP-binding protein